MPEEKTIKVIVGEKISQEEAEKFDPAKRIITIIEKPTESDASGQMRELGGFYVKCPWCGGIGRPDDKNTPPYFA